MSKWQHLIEADRDSRDLERKTAGGDDSARLRLKYARAREGYGWESYGHPLFDGICKLLTNKKTITGKVAGTSRTSSLLKEFDTWVIGYYRPSNKDTKVKVEIRAFKNPEAILGKSSHTLTNIDIRENSVIFGIIDVTMERGGLVLGPRLRSRRQWQCDATARMRVQGPDYSVYNERPLHLDHVHRNPHMTTPKKVLTALWERVHQACPNE